ncbi:hypothetical protein ABZ297_26455 [Nonomuraea sp. NPDC005983]|uniref:hypothetical protein n=1 Tax=Nonomuraea sp. NPDC005983 TaxID=3155595 RepID=UPI0033ACA99C
MSSDDHEQPGGAEPANETFVPLLRRGPADAQTATRPWPSGSEPGEAQGGPQRLVEVSA